MYTINDKIEISRRTVKITGIRKDLILFTVISACGAVLISLPVLGPNILFPLGLAIGVGAAIAALFIISFSIEKAAESGKRNPVMFGFFVRIFLYGGALWLAAKLIALLPSAASAALPIAGAAIGLLIPHAVLYIKLGLLPVIMRKIRREPDAVWITDTRGLMFVKEPSLMKQNKGRTYLTHRHYRKIRVVPDSPKAANGAGKR